MAVLVTGSIALTACTSSESQRPIATYCDRLQQDIDSRADPDGKGISEAALATLVTRTWADHVGRLLATFPDTQRPAVSRVLDPLRAINESSLGVPEFLATPAGMAQLAEHDGSTVIASAQQLDSQAVIDCGLPLGLEAGLSTVRSALQVLVGPADVDG